MRLQDIPAPPAPHERARIRRRSRIIQYVIAALFLVLIGRLWYLQIARGEMLLKASEENRRRLERKTAQRGDIVDRSGVLLAGTRPQFVVSVSPQLFNVDGPEARRLAQYLGIPPEELRRRAKPVANYKRARVAVDISRKTLALLKEKQPWLPGVSVDLENLRYYPRGKLGAHLLGTIGPVSEDDLKSNPGIYAPDARIGKSGLERIYEEKLRGRDGGLEIEVNAAGERTRLITTNAPVRGDDLILTINSKVQAVAEERLTGRVGSAVAIDPNNGEILAMASRPAYDPNLFARGIGVEDWRAIINDKRKPLLNRVVQSAYPPASTFKLVTSLAALRAGRLSPSSGVRCGGAVRLGTRTFRCWRAHGYVDFADAIAQSCDIFFYRYGAETGPEALAAMARSFGLGSRSGLDMTGEARGTVPDTGWKKRKFKNDPKWHKGETYNMSIGQGYLEATPLQVAMMASGVAMKGFIYRPHLLRAVQRERGIRKEDPELLYHVELPARYFDLVMDGMRRAVTHGTSASAALPGINVAGKTGSAQTSGPAHAWFVCVAPAEKPQIVVCVMVEHGRHGSEAAAPIARDMMAAYFGLQNAGSARRVRGD